VVPHSSSRCVRGVPETRSGIKLRVALHVLATEAGGARLRARVCASPFLPPPPPHTQVPGWQQARSELMQHLESTLASYYVRVTQASPDDPVTLPSSHWVSNEWGGGGG
jgi:hypothetical protein